MKIKEVSEIIRLRQSMAKNTGRMRYTFVALIIKHLTPSLYKKFNLISLVGGQIFPFISNGVSVVPRPSIKIMKKKFNGKLVKGVEVGVNSGRNSKSILEELNVEKLYLVDIWNNYEEIDYVRSNIDRSYKSVLKKFRKDKRVRIIKDFSENAVKNMDDNSLDFVYIDANHTYNYVYQDIDLWFRKVKEGGIVAGHDVFNCSEVLDAVKDFCSKNKIVFHIKLPDWYFIK